MIKSIVSKMAIKLKHYINITFVMFILLQTNITQAVETSKAATTPAPATSSLGVNLLETFGVLLLVIALLFGMAFLLKRLNPQMMQHGEMQIIAAMSLGGKDRLILVNIGEEQQLLLGVSPGRVTLIQSFSPPIISSTEKPERLASTFKKLLSQAANKSMKKEKDDI